MTSQLTKLTGFTFLVVLLAGCAVKQPVSKVTAVEVSERTSEGIRMLVDVDVNNPNNVPLPVTNVMYRVRLDGVGMFEFTELGDLTLASRGKQSLKLPAAFALPEDVSLEGRRYSVYGHVYYRPPGELRAILDAYKFPLPASTFHAIGRIDKSFETDFSFDKPETSLLDE